MEDKTKEYNKKYYIDNKQQLLENTKKYYDDNKDNYKSYYQKNKEKKKQYNLDNREKIKLQREIKSDEIKSKIQDYMVKRYKDDPLFKLSSNIRNSIYKSFKKSINGKFSKSKRTQEILGCDFLFFKEYIESKFEPWMNWENYGLYNGELDYGWDLDHKIPSFSVVDESDIYKINHYSNFQPLCSKVNRDIKRHNF